MANGSIEVFLLCARRFLLRAPLLNDLELKLMKCRIDRIWTEIRYLLDGIVFEGILQSVVWSPLSNAHSLHNRNLVFLLCARCFFSVHSIE